MSLKHRQDSLPTLDIAKTINDMEQQFPAQPLTVLDVLGIDYADVQKPEGQDGVMASAVSSLGGELEDNA